MTKKIIIYSFLGLVLVGAIISLVDYKHQLNNQPAVSDDNVLQVVAAENFWGSLVSQIGGSHVNITSVVSDPNADPHEYSSNAANARAFATADYVIINGLGYDSWANKLLSANFNSKQKILNVGDLVGKKEGDNPHLWYSPDYVNQTAAQMEKDLISLDPRHRSDYEHNYKNLRVSLLQYQNRINDIKQKFGGTKVAATEDIFVYLAEATGLDLISPPAFIQAVAEGNDPSVSSVIEFENQLTSREPKVLIYNKQTVTPLTENMNKLAFDNKIPSVGITETIQPPNISFQAWMGSELLALENALNR